jgi:HK97 family phage prohead protease
MSTPKREIRNLTAPVELRAEGDGNRLVGYASRFNEPINPFFDWPEFTEVVHPDCFNRTLKEMPDVRALFNHDPAVVLGRASAGTLRLTVDATGLAFEVDLPDTQAGRDVKVSVARRDITGCSIGFCVVKDDVVSDRETGAITRTLLDVDLFEVTPACSFPANLSTEVSLRSALNSRLHAADPRPNLDLIRLIRRRSGR